MISARPPAPLRAKGPRFLVGLSLCWIAARFLVGGDDARLLPPPPAAPDADWAERALPSPLQIPALAAAAQPWARAAPAPPALQLVLSDTPRAILFAAGTLPPTFGRSASTSSGDGDGGWASSNRHRWRAAMLDGLLSDRSQHRPAHVSPASPMATALKDASGRGPEPPASPVWPTSAQRGADRWSLYAYAYWRGNAGGGAAVAAPGAAQPPVLGGSQLGLRLDRRLDAAGRVRAYARVTAAPMTGGRSAADAALGLAWRPADALPVDLHVERREALAGGGRGQMLAYAAGGTQDRPLALGLRGHVYGQAGVAGFGDPALFADGQLQVDRIVTDRADLRFSLGAVAAGGVQRGAAQLDIGPRAALSLPKLGEGTRLALDWRERIAGDARPASGLALTLSAGF
jgi:hypothetical protein